MTYFKRLLGNSIQKAIARDKSILLLGPRQTGKTTFVREELSPDLELSFVSAATRLRYEKSPELLELEITAYVEKSEKKPLIFIDEVQKIPSIMDSVQYIIDKKQAAFILSGSSARQLKHGKKINLLPGRVVLFVMQPFTFNEMAPLRRSLDDILLYGALPAIACQNDTENKEIDLGSYVTSYLEEEIRAEAVVRNVGHFAKFLQFAAIESGQQIHYSKLSQNIGVAATTIAAYFQVLVDCLIAIRIEPITSSKTKRRLIKSSRYLFFDLGIRRLCANEGTQLPMNSIGHLFEQFIGLELHSYAQMHMPPMQLKYWRDSAGPEVDYVLESGSTYIPVEVKYSEHPKEKDIRHLEKFLDENDNVKYAYVVCRTPRPYIIEGKYKIHVIPWQEINTIFDSE